MPTYGEVTEWFKVTVLKTVVGQLTESSNLSLSAKIINNSLLAGYFYTFVGDTPPREPTVPRIKLTAANARKAMIRPTIA